jgi:DNA-binding transcriptional LysR family regulator
MEATPGFTLVQLRYFVASAEAGSMTAAAERLVIAQSAVSTAVSNLEKDLQLQLFIRRRARGLTLTPAGERFLHQARDLLNQAREMAEEARGTGLHLSGPVAVGCFVTMAPLYLPPRRDRQRRGGPHGDRAPARPRPGPRRGHRRPAVRDR